MSERNPEYRPGQTIWRARRFGAREGAAVTYQPFCAHNHITRAGLECCGAQIVADEGDNWRVKVLLAPSIVGERTVSKALAPRAMLGDAVVLRVEGADQTVVEVLDGIPTYRGSDQAE